MRGPGLEIGGEEQESSVGKDQEEQARARRANWKRAMWRPCQKGTLPSYSQTTTLLPSDV